MALQKQTVSFNLANGVDQKDDDFVGDANTFDAMTDFIWDKDRRLSKRLGTDANNQTVSTSFPNPLTIGASPIRSGTFSHGNQLLLQNKGALYSKDVQGNNWRFKGHHYPMNARTEVEHASALQITKPSVVKFGNYLIDTYIGFDGFINESSVRYRVYDTSTENQIVLDQVIETSTGTAISSVAPIVFAGDVYISWINSANIKITKLTLPAGTFGAVTTLKTDNAYTDFQWVVCNKAGVGERAFCYYTRGSDGVIFSVLNTGAVDATMGTSIQTRGAMSLYYSALFQRLYFSAYYPPAPAGYDIGIVNFTTAGFTNVFAENVVYKQPNNFTTSKKPIKAVWIDDSLTATGVLHFLNDQEGVYYGTSGTAEPQDTIQYKTYSATAGVGSFAIYAKGLSLFGQPVYRSDRMTIYLPCEHVSQNQGTLFLLDFYRGKTEGGLPYAYVQAKTSYRTHVATSSPFISPACALTASDYVYASQIATRISSSSASLNPTVAGIVYQTGIGRTKYSFLPNYSASRAYLSGSTHLSGGYLGIYDGNEFCEHNFFLQPTSLEARSLTTTAVLIVTVTQLGGVGRETSTVVFPPAILLKGFTGPSSYFTFWSSVSTQVNVGYRVAGVGTIPTASGTNILVELTGNEPAYEVMLKTAQGLTGLGGIGIAPLSNNTLEIANIGTGAVPDISTTNMTYSGFDGPGAGARSFAVIWSWTDNNGLQHRSAPATIGAMASGTGQYPIALTAYCPMVTNRKVGSVRAEFYSTVIGGTTFYRLGLLQNLPSWQINAGSISFVSTQSDTQITSGEILYTQGGILPNSSMEACTAVSTFKNRLVISGTNDNYVYYSKVAQNNLPVEVAEVLFLATENDGQKVTAHAQLDDKLMVLKTQSLSAYAGDGANDLGTGVSFSLPISIASDVGSVNPSSLATTPQGLWFKSKMGIQMVTRGLEVVYPGSFVKDYNVYDVSRTEVLRDDKNVREVRFVLQGAPYTLVYNYQLNKWAVFSQYGGDDATLWQGKFTRVDSSGVVYTENQSTWIDAGSTVPSYSPVFKTTWMKLKNVQDYQRIWRMILLGALKSPHTLNVKCYYDYDSTNFDSYQFLSSAITGTAYDDSVYQPEFHLKRQKCQSIQIEMQLVATGGSEQCLTMTDLSFLVGIKQGLNKVKKGKKL